MLETVRTKLSDQSSLGSKVVAALRDAIVRQQPTDINLLTVHAERIARCNNTGNHWLASDLHSQQGDAYDGGGRFWRCFSKLCPDCLATQTRRTRKKLRFVISEQKLMVGEDMRLMTLTVPNLGLSLMESRKLIYTAWCLFRKRKWFKEQIRGGFKAEEFTFTRRGYHYHIHLLIASKKIDYYKFRSEWTDCVKAAASASPHRLEFATSDGLAIANVKRLHDLNNAIFEVCKYVTKSGSWSDIPTDDLLNVARIAHFPRMTEFFGSFRLAERLEGTSLPEANDGESELFPEDTILDKNSVSDGESGGNPDRWRNQVEMVGVAEYLTKLDEQIIETTLVRMQQLKHHYAAATFFARRSTRQLSPDEVSAWIKLHSRNRAHPIRIKFDGDNLEYAITD